MEADAGSSSMSKAEILRGIVAEKLTTAALEILAVVERTVAGYEEEASGLRQEIDRQSRQLEVLLQPRVKLERIEDEFPVSEPAAGEGGGPELPEDEEQHKYEPSVEESLGPLSFSEAGMEDEDEEDEEHLTEPDYEESSRLLTPSVQSDRRGRGRPRMRQSQDHVDLRIRILEDSQINVLSVEVYKKYPVQELRCPRGLQEADFLDLLRSTFPQLAAQKPFEVFTADRMKRLQPLSVDTLTPEEIYRSVRSTGHSAVYIQLKTPEELRSTAKEFHPSQRNDPAADSPSTSDQTGFLSSRVESNRRKPGRPRLSELQNHVNLRIRILEDSEVDKLTPYVFQQCPQQDIKCPRGLQEADFLHLLRSSFPQLAGQEPFDLFTLDQMKKLQPLRLDILTPEEINRTAGRSALYIRLKRPEGVQTRDEEPLQRQDADTDSTSTDQTTLDMEVQSERTKPGRPRLSDLQNHVDLRICILEDSQIDVLSPSVYRRYPVLELQVPRGMEEADFLDLLRSTFPQLAAQEPFDIFTSDKSKRLQPLRVETLTPEEIYRSIRLNGGGYSALYIRLKAEDVQSTGEELHLADAVKDSPSTFDQTRQNRSSSRSRHEVTETEDDEDGDRSKSAVGRLWSLLVLGEGDRDGGPVSDDDWRPDISEELAADDEPKKKKKRHVKIKRQSEQIPSTDNADAPLSCKVCRTRRGSTNMLIKHAWSHVDGPERLCGVCGEHLESAEELRSHLQSHQKTHNCNICGKSFLSVTGLSGHVAQHNGQKPHKCRICHKAFVHKWVLKNHMLIHTADKPLKCDFCTKTFDSKVEYSQHRLIHHRERVNRCNTCGKIFSSLEQLSRHLPKHSLPPGRETVKETVRQTVRATMFPCEVCGKPFKAKHTLKVHMRVHTGEKPFNCSVCDKAFRYKHCVRRHMKTHQDQTDASVQIPSDRINGSSAVVDPVR